MMPFMVHARPDILERLELSRCRDNPAAVAASSIMELRYAVTVLGVDHAHGLMDELETVILNHLRRER